MKNYKRYPTINNDNNLFLDKSIKNITNITTNNHTTYFIFQVNSSFRYLKNISNTITDNSTINNTKVKKYDQIFKEDTFNYNVNKSITQNSPNSART